MATVTVELSTTEWCGYSEHYEIPVADDAEVEEWDIEDAALEKHLEDFCAMFDLVEHGDGYAVMGEEEDGTSTISARVIW